MRTSCDFSLKNLRFDENSTGEIWLGRGWSDVIKSFKLKQKNENMNFFKVRQQRDADEQALV